MVQLAKIKCAATSAKQQARRNDSNGPQSHGNTATLTVFMDLVNKMKPILLVVGTRPGAIKSIPLYQALKKTTIPTFLCATFQHDELLQQVFDIFRITPDISLKIMKKDQDLFHITTSVLEKMRDVYLKIDPELVLVHGDTATAFASALAAFYLKIPVGHLEAGLRTGNIYAPFPEEVCRKYISTIASYHFAPTSLNVGNLLAEGIARDTVFCTGNIIVDALEWIQQEIESGAIALNPIVTQKVLACKQNGKKLILLTAHRRESFDGGLLRIFNSIKKFAQQHDDLFIFYPVHPNPNVQAALEQAKLHEVPSIYLSQALAYQDLIYLILSSAWVMTDSGGIQEEAMSIGKKVIILRDVTERIEGVWEGLGMLAGTDENLITKYMSEFYLLPNTDAQATTIYGDGKASARIVSILKTKLLQNKLQPKISPLINV